MFDYRIGRRQNIFRGAVVLLQLDGTGFGIIFLKVHDVADVRATPAIDGLVSITHDTEVMMFGRQNLGQLILRTIGILIFVHQNVLKTVLVLDTDFLMFFQKQHRYHEQIIKVHGVIGTQLLGIKRIDLGHFLLEEILRIPGHRLRPHQLIFRIGNGILNRAGGILLGVKVQFLQTFLDDHLTVAAVVDNEIALVHARCFHFPPQESGTEGMEGGEPYILSPLANHSIHTFPHFRGGFIGKGNGQNAPWCYAFSQKISHLARQYLSLTGTGTGHNEKRPICMLHRLFLGGIQSCKYIQNNLQNSLLHSHLTVDH